MKRLNLLMLLFFLLVAALFMIAASFKPAAAQDIGITVCHDTSYPTPRFEFRNIPASWFVYGSDDYWNYWAGGVAMLPEQGLIVADALPADTDGFAADTAVLVDYNDNITWIGDATTAACDSAPSPTEQPVPQVSCPAMTINGVTGKLYCYTPLAHDVVPVPEAISQ